MLTAAGSAAALDLGLHVIRTDYGAEVGCVVAKRLAFPVHRDGFQSQSVDRVLPRTRDWSVTPLLTWAQSRLHEPIGCPSWPPRPGSASPRCTAGSPRRSA